jgi:hypothetical protein
VIFPQSINEARSKDLASFFTHGVAMFSPSPARAFFTPRAARFKIACGNGENKLG